VIHTRKLPSFTNLLCTHAALPLYTTASKITKPAKNIPSRQHWNTPGRLSSIRKKLIGSQKMQPESLKDESTGHTSKANF
jgi:hypothetical protein